MSRDRLYLADDLLDEAWSELQDAVTRDPPAGSVLEAIDRIESILLAREIKLLPPEADDENDKSPA